MDTLYFITMGATALVLSVLLLAMAAQGSVTWYVCAVLIGLVWLGLYMQARDPRLL